MDFKTVAVLFVLNFLFLHQTDACCWRRSNRSNRKKTHLYSTPDTRNDVPRYTQQMATSTTEKSPEEPDYPTLHPVMTPRPTPGNDFWYPQAATHGTQRSTETPREENTDDNTVDKIIVPVAASGAAVLMVLAIVVAVVVIRKRRAKETPPTAEDIYKEIVVDKEAQEIEKKAPLEELVVPVADVYYK